MTAPAPPLRPTGQARSPGSTLLPWNVARVVKNLAMLYKDQGPRVR